MVGISANGKRQSRTEFSQYGNCLPFAQTDQFARVNGNYKLCVMCAPFDFVPGTCPHNMPLLLFPQYEQHTIFVAVTCPCSMGMLQHLLTIVTAP